MTRGSYDLINTIFIDISNEVLENKNDMVEGFNARFTPRPPPLPPIPRR